MTDKRDASQIPRSCQIFVQIVDDLDCARMTEEDAAGGIHTWQAFKKILRAGRAEHEIVPTCVVGGMKIQIQIEGLATGHMVNS